MDLCVFQKARVRKALLSERDGNIDRDKGFQSNEKSSIESKLRSMESDIIDER